MRKALIFSLIALFLGNFSLSTFVFLNFKLHQEQIAAELCKEKDIPNSCCKGSCHLEDQFKALDQEPEDAESPILEQFKIQAFLLESHTKPIAKAKTSWNLLPKFMSSEYVKPADIPPPRS